MNFGDEMIFYGFAEAIKDLPEDNNVKKASQQLLNHLKELSRAAETSRDEAKAARRECAKYIELISIMSAAYNDTLKSLDPCCAYNEDDEWG